MGIPAFEGSPFRKTRVTATRNRLKMTRAKTQLCLTPAKTSNGSDSWPPTVTLADMPSWKACSIRRKCGGQPNLLRTFHKRSLLTVSKALVRSMKARKRLWCCSRHFSCSRRATKIMSVVPRPRRKPDCDSGITMSTTCVRSLRSITRARTLPATDSKEIPRLLPHSALSPLRWRWWQTYTHTQTHTVKFIFCPCIALDTQWRCLNKVRSYVLIYIPSIMCQCKLWLPLLSRHSR